MKKRQDIELLRVISAFGIVWFHSGVSGNDFAYSGLIIFLVISLYLSAQSTNTAKGVTHRARRLLVPWLVWFGFYGLMNLARHKPFLSIDNGIISGILTGTSIHLWYMPFIFITLISFDWIRNKISPRIVGYTCGTLTVFVLASSTAWRPLSFQLGAPFAQYAHATSGVLIGIFFAHYYNMAVSARTMLLIAILALAMYLTLLPLPGIGLPYLLGTGICAVILLSKNQIPDRFSINWLSECTLGIYLIHPVFFIVNNKSQLASGIYVPIVVFLASAATVILVKRFAPNSIKHVF